MQHVIPKPPDVESGKAKAYRGTTADMRAAEATNGVPKLEPPFTDGQLCALYRVSRAQLKQTRTAQLQKNGDSTKATSRDVLRDRQLTDLIDELSRAAHRLHNQLHHNSDSHITFDVAMDALWALDNAADELTKLRG